MGRNKQDGQRRLKVYQRYISRTYFRYIALPEIRLCGKWLQDVGFKCGQSVNITHEKNKIIITVDNDTMKAKSLTSLSNFIDKEIGRKGSKRRDKFEIGYQAFKLKTLRHKK